MSCVHVRLKAVIYMTRGFVCSDEVIVCCILCPWFCVFRWDLGLFYSCPGFLCVQVRFMSVVFHVSSFVCSGEIYVYCTCISYPELLCAQVRFMSVIFHALSSCVFRWTWYEADLKPIPTTNGRGNSTCNRSVSVLQAKLVPDQNPREINNLIWIRNSQYKISLP